MSSVPVGGAVVDVGDIASAQAASNLKPMCRLLQVATGTVISSSVQATLSWDTEDYDYGGLHVAGSANVVVTRAGVWRCVGVVHVPARADYLTHGLVVMRNAANQPAWWRQGPNGTSNQRSMGPVISSLLCAVGDTLSLGAFQSNTAVAAVTTAVGSSFESSFEVEFIRDA